MIQEVRGDLLLAKTEAIAHGVAPNDDFHQGLALALRERWPAMYKDFRHYCHVSHPQSGGLWSWAGTEGRQITLFTQEGAYDHGGKPGRAHLSHVNHSLRELHKLIEKEHIKSIALPRLATGVGGLNWDDVKPLIQEHLGKLAIPVYVVTTFVAGQELVPETT